MTPYTTNEAALGRCRRGLFPYTNRSVCASSLPVVEQTSYQYQISISILIWTWLLILIRNPSALYRGCATNSNYLRVTLCPEIGETFVNKDVTQTFFILRVFQNRVIPLYTAVFGMRCTPSMSVKRMPPYPGSACFAHVVQLPPMTLPWTQSCNFGAQNYHHRSVVHKIIQLTHWYIPSGTITQGSHRPTRSTREGIPLGRYRLIREKRVSNCYIQEKKKLSVCVCGCSANLGFSVEKMSWF